MKRLFLSERRVSVESTQDFAKMFQQTLEMALRGKKHEELEHICLSLRRAIRRLKHGDSRKMRVRERLEVFREAVHPRMASEVAMRNPQAAFVLWQAAQGVSDTEWSYRFGREMFEFAFHRKHPMELMEHDPDAWMAWLELIQDMGGGRFLEPSQRNFFHPELFGRALDLRHLLKLSERNPEGVLAFVQLARKLGGGRFFERHGEEFLERAIDPRHLLDLSERNPGAALALVQLARELGGDGKFLNPKSFERVLHPGHFLELTESNSEVALAWLQMARELGGDGFLERYGEEFFDRTFNRFSLAGLLRQSPLPSPWRYDSPELQTRWELLRQWLSA